MQIAQNNFVSGIYFFRVNRLERDTSQKRNLLEEQKSKLKQIQSSAKTDANAVVSIYDSLTADL